MDILTRIKATIVRNCAEYHFLAHLTGRTVAETETDLTAPDPIGGGRET